MADEAQAPKLSPEQRIAALNNPEAAPAAAAPPGETVQTEEHPEAAPVEGPGDDEQEAPTEPGHTETEEVSAEAADVIEISDLDGLAEHLGTDVSSLYDLTIPVSINGKRENVRLGDWKDSYTATAEATKAREEARALRDNVTTQRDEAMRKAATHVAEAEALVSALEQEAVARFQGVPWEELRQNDPSEWAAKRREMDETQGRLLQAKQAVGQRIQQIQQQTQEQQTATQKELLEKEWGALTASWPEMADESKAEAERSKLRDYFKSTGFSDQEIGNANDHRLLLMARDAMRYRETVKGVDAAKKKVVKIATKVLKPGAKQSKADQASDATRAARQRLKKSGNWQDAAALISKRGL